MLNSEVKIVSRIGQLRTSAMAVYGMISDLSFLDRVPAPADKVRLVSCDADSCRFDLDGKGQFSLTIVERRPGELVKIVADEGNPMNIKMWIQLKEVATCDTRVRVTVHVTANPLVKAMIQKPLTNFVEQMVSKLEERFGGAVA